MTLFPEQHADKLLLTVLLLVCIAIAVAGACSGRVVDFVMDAGKQILAALLTLMVGQRVMQRKSDNGDKQ